MDMSENMEEEIKTEHVKPEQTSLDSAEQGKFPNSKLKI